MHRLRGLVFAAGLMGLLAAVLSPSAPAASGAGNPTIDGFSPASGPVGTPVVVTGTDFSLATEVQFNAVDAVFTIASDTEIDTTVPVGATTGLISVVTPDGTAVSLAGFTVASPIQHIIVIDEENHSFDNLLGAFCAQVAGGLIQRDPCDGATTGTLPDGSTISLGPATDLVPEVGHSVAAQQRAIDHNRMDGFANIIGCGAAQNYACYTQFDPTQIPNITSVATQYALSDRTFEFSSTPSWGGPMVLASASLDGFKGDIPLLQPGQVKGNGWGCDSNKDAQWWDGTRWVLEPSCVPDASGNGPYRTSPVLYVPTIFDRLDAAGLTWKIYGGGAGVNANYDGYSWAICPTFYECLGSGQRQNLVKVGTIVQDAAAGNLPNYAIVTPTGPVSQHNNYSTATGDNWLAKVFTALQTSPEWSSTAVFLMWDDCGCFYDHVPPPDATWGIRLPMIIISPFAKPGYTDSVDASMLATLAFTEHTFGLAPLGTNDASAYDYANSFDYQQAHLAPTHWVTTPIPRWELRWIEEHATLEDDPT